MKKITVLAAIIMAAICLAACIAESTIDPKTIAVGDIVTFGHFSQDKGPDNSIKPIEWIVLDVQDGKALMLSKYGLFATGYHSTWDECTWETCSLRTWLNDRFLKYAFSAEEQSAVLLTTVDNSDSQGYDWTLIGEEKTTGWNNTQDKVFLLSYAEANRYLNVTVEDVNNTGSRVAPTALAISAGADVSNDCLTADGEAAGGWWLRTPGGSPKCVEVVSREGSLSYLRTYHKQCIVRPAVWIDLNSDLF